MGFDASSTLPLRFYYASVTLLLRSHYDNEDPATLSLHWWRYSCDLASTKLWSYAFVSLLYPFYIKSEVQKIYLQLNVNDRRTHVAILRLAILNLSCWTIGGPGKTKSDGQRSWVPSWLSADRRLQCGHYVHLIRALSMEDGYSLFNYMRMEPLRIGPRIQKRDTNFRRALEPGLNAKSIAEAWQKRGRSAKVDYVLCSENTTKINLTFND